MIAGHDVRPGRFLVPQQASMAAAVRVSPSGRSARQGRTISAEANEVIAGPSRVSISPPGPGLLATHIHTHHLRHRHRHAPCLYLHNPFPPRPAFPVQGAHACTARQNTGPTTPCNSALSSGAFIGHGDGWAPSTSDTDGSSLPFGPLEFDQTSPRNPATIVFQITWPSNSHTTGLPNPNGRGSMR